MEGIHDLGLFVLSGLLLNVTPGADTLYIVARGTTQGARRRRRRARNRRGLHRAHAGRGRSVGALFVALGLRLAFAERR